MVMGHSAAPATVSQPAPAGSSGCWLPGSEVAISVPGSQQPLEPAEAATEAGCERVAGAAENGFPDAHRSR